MNGYIGTFLDLRVNRKCSIANNIIYSNFMKRYVKSPLKKLEKYPVITEIAQIITSDELYIFSPPKSLSFIAV